ncbi:MAG: aa3-type cytochrome c oxidase subunit IV [Caulobacterales bacterium]|nr:aa3-type cytochrome c oxidase subunit IV [Caulobacterales bacterium]
MAGPAPKDSDYVRGEMAVVEHEKTYMGFLSLAKWCSLGLAAIVLFFTMWLYPRGNFMGAAVSTFVLLAVGIYVLRKPQVIES